MMSMLGERRRRKAGRKGGREGGREGEREGRREGGHVLVPCLLPLLRKVQRARPGEALVRPKPQESK
jgi:hypothetical protein